MAGIIAVYSLVIAVLIAGDLDPDKDYALFEYDLRKMPSVASERAMLIRNVVDLCI